MFFSIIISQSWMVGKLLPSSSEARKVCSQTIFPQILMAHAVSALAANFDLVVDKFDGCGIPVFIRHLVCGKSTALKAVLSVFSDTALISSKFDVLCFFTICLLCQYCSTCLYLSSKSSKQTSKTHDSRWFKLKGTH